MGDVSEGVLERAKHGGPGRDQQAGPRYSRSLQNLSPIGRGHFIAPMRRHFVFHGPLSQKRSPQCRRFPEAAGPLNSDFLPRRGS